VLYVSIRYTERLAEASVEGFGREFRRLLRYCDGRESINGLYKAEVIHRQSWQNCEAVELAILTWVDEVNHRRLLKTMGHISPAEAEAREYQQRVEFVITA